MTASICSEVSRPAVCHSLRRSPSIFSGCVPTYAMYSRICNGRGFGSRGFVDAAATTAPRRPRTPCTGAPATGGVSGQGFVDAAATTAPRRPCTPCTGAPATGRVSGQGGCGRGSYDGALDACTRASASATGRLLGFVDAAAAPSAMRRHGP
eukprot:136097-Chlamydomonas_euryale.AAC.1